MTVKRLCCAALALILLLTLGACGKQAFDPQQVADRYAEGTLSAEYTVTTHAGFYTEYKLSCSLQNGVSTVTILQPESVAGVTAVLQDGDGKIQYEDVILDALLPEVAGYAPIDVLHRLLEDLAGGIPMSHSVENDVLTLEYQTILQDGTEAVKRLLLHPETLDLQAAELYLDGSLILALQASSFQWTQG